MSQGENKTKTTNKRTNKIKLRCVPCLICNSKESSARCMLKPPLSYIGMCGRACLKPQMIPLYWGRWFSQIPITISKQAGVVWIKIQGFISLLTLGVKWSPGCFGQRNHFSSILSAAYFLIICKFIPRSMDNYSALLIWLGLEVKSKRQSCTYWYNLLLTST